MKYYYIDKSGKKHKYVGNVISENGKLYGVLTKTNIIPINVELKYNGSSDKVLSSNTTFTFIDEDNIEKYGSCTEQGLYAPYYKGECTFFPSKDQRDWNKFIAPWYKKERFDPKTLKPFDEVLVFDSDTPWTPLMFSYLEYSLNYPRMQCFDFTARKVIPYNKETEHLLGTHNEAPEYYRYWEE